MKDTTISANVRFSKALGDGAYKTVELGAEAVLSPKDSWDEAQALLYQELGQQLKSLWSNKSNGKSDTNADALPEHYCQEHQTEFNRYEKGYQVWYSHKAGSRWCKEQV